MLAQSQIISFLSEAVLNLDESNIAHRVTLVPF